MTRRKLISNSEKALPAGATLEGADPDILTHAEHFLGTLRELLPPTVSLLNPEEALRATQITDELRAKVESKKRALRFLQQNLQELKAKIEAATRQDGCEPEDLEQ